MIRDKKSYEIIINVSMSKNKLFSLEISSDENHAFVVKKSSESILWHLRYRHLNVFLMKRQVDLGKKIQTMYKLKV